MAGFVLAGVVVVGVVSGRVALVVAAVVVVVESALVVVVAVPLVVALILVVRDAVDGLEAEPHAAEANAVIAMTAPAILRATSGVCHPPAAANWSDGNAIGRQRYRRSYLRFG